MTLERALVGSSFASGFEPAELRTLAALAEKRIFEDGDLMVRTGERSRAFYVLLSGSASVELQSSFFKLRIQALAPGDAFGWSSLLDHYDTLFQVRAREHCTALCIESDSIATLCHDNPSLGVKLMQRVLQTVAGRIRGLESSLATFCGIPAPDGRPDRAAAPAG
jgi:CRP-like cAMP-binding protein